MRTIRKVVRSKAFRIVGALAFTCGIAFLVSEAPASAASTSTTVSTAPASAPVPETIMYAPGRVEDRVTNCDARMARPEGKDIVTLKTNGKSCLSRDEWMVGFVGTGKGIVKYPQEKFDLKRAINGTSMSIPRGCVFAQFDVFTEERIIAMSKKDKQGNPIKDSHGRYVLDTLTKENDHGAIAWIVVPCLPALPPTTQPAANTTTSVPPTTAPSTTLPTQPTTPDTSVPPASDAMATQDEPTTSTTSTTEAPQVSSTSIVEEQPVVEAHLARTGTYTAKFAVLGLVLLIIGGSFLLVAWSRNRRNRQGKTSA